MKVLILSCDTGEGHNSAAAAVAGALTRRGIDYQFGAGTFWGWGILGSLILVGPFIYTHKLLTAMNLLSADYNVNG